jgi:hypothetical protein
MRWTFELDGVEHDLRFSAVAFAWPPEKLVLDGVRLPIKRDDLSLSLRYRDRHFQIGEHHCALRARWIGLVPSSGVYYWDIVVDDAVWQSRARVDFGYALTIGLALAIGGMVLAVILARFL